MNYMDHSRFVTLSVKQRNIMKNLTNITPRYTYKDFLSNMCKQVANLIYIDVYGKLNGSEI